MPFRVGGCTGRMAGVLSRQRQVRRAASPEEFTGDLAPAGRADPGPPDFAVRGMSAANRWRRHTGDFGERIVGSANQRSAQRSANGQTMFAGLRFEPRLNCEPASEHPGSATLGDISIAVQSKIMHGKHHGTVVPPPSRRRAAAHRSPWRSVPALSRGRRSAMNRHSTERGRRDILRGQLCQLSRQ